MKKIFHWSCCLSLSLLLVFSLSGFGRKKSKPHQNTPEQEAAEIQRMMALAQAEEKAAEKEQSAEAFAFVETAVEEESRSTDACRADYEACLQRADAVQRRCQEASDTGAGAACDEAFLSEMNRCQVRYEQCLREALLNPND